MSSGLSKLILVMVMALISYNATANGDDDKKSTKRTFLNNHSKGNKIKKEDSLTYTKHIDDTLTFDDKKISEDTLIFADDEMKIKGSPKNQNNNREFSIINSEKSVGLSSVIYPNPSYGQSVLEMNTPDNSATEIIITSHDGTLIRKVTTTGKSYELKDLAAGTYLITIKNGDQVIQKRLFVK